MEYVKAQGYHKQDDTTGYTWLAINLPYITPGTEMAVLAARKSISSGRHL